MNEGALLTWEARQRGERPIKPPVSCLTPKYEEPIRRDSAVMVLYQNKTVFRLPGQGEQTNNKCGQWSHPLSCPNHGQMTLEGKHHDRFVVQRSCHNPDCPVCYESWTSRQGGNSSDKLIQAYGLYKKEGFVLGKIKHVVFSPPQDLAKELIRTSGGAKTLRSMAIKTVKKAGMVAGAIIFHPFRQNDPREDNYSKDMPDYVWYESPHFHVVGVGYLKKSDEFYADTRWVYNNIGRRETVKGTIKYTLTHCGIVDGFQAVTYFGLFSNNKVVIDKIEKVTEPIKCQACGEALHLYSLKDTDESLEVDWDDDLGVYLRVVVKKTYKLRVKPCCVSVASGGGYHEIS